MKNEKNGMFIQLLCLLLATVMFMIALPLQAEEKAATDSTTELRKLEGVVVEHLSREGLKNLTVSLSADGELLERKSITKNGSFAFDFTYKKGVAYKLTAEKETYITEVIDLSLALEKHSMPKRMEVSLAKQDFSFVFKGNILDRDNAEPIPNTRITVRNTRSGEVTELASDYNGEYSFKVVSGYEYDVVVESRNYLKRYAHINYCSDALEDNQKYCFFGFTGPTLDPAGGVTAAKIQLDKVEIGKKFAVKNIYYDYNKATLRSDALPNLRKLYHILDDNPQLIVELGSHADSRGSDQYNLKLSQQRAESAVSYILEQDIATKRIVAKGYGENLLLNECANDVECSDSQHERNRRTEFTIIDIDESVFGKKL